MKDGQLITGQNPASSEKLAACVLETIKPSVPAAGVPLEFDVRGIILSFGGRRPKGTAAVGHKCYHCPANSDKQRGMVRGATGTGTNKLMRWVQV